MSAEFRQILNRRGSGKSERLVRAAVSAFCSLPRPTRREIQQLGQLTLPLFERIPVEARRFVAASLSDSRSAPRDLVLRLCDEPVDVCAPLLIRSPVLSDADLVRIIGNKGAAHARVILRRRGLHPAIALLSERLDKATGNPVAVASRAVETPAAEAPMEMPFASASSDPAEAVRGRLRQIMAGSQPASLPFPHSSATSQTSGVLDYRRMKANVLSGNLAFFQTALSDALGIEYATAEAIVESRSYDDLIAALKRIDLSEEEAFLLVCAACPDRFGKVEEIRAFTERYRALPPCPSASRSPDGFGPVSETALPATGARIVQMVRG